ncbi:MAG: response regulator, partial [Anaerolineales bacterium]
MPEKILIVDDDVNTLRLLGMMLENKGYEIFAAKGGNDALSIAQNELPSLIILDVMMPDMDGYETAQHLRNDPRTKKIPIVMFTAKTEIDDKIMGLESGADVYLTKPLRPREIIAQINAILSRTQPEPQTTEPSKSRGYIIGVISSKGGVGVSTLVINLSISIQENLGKEVIAAEYRPGYGGISLDLGYSQPTGLNRLLQSKPQEITSQEIETELVAHPTGVRFLLASTQPKDAHYLTANDQFEAITRHLVYMADIVILDLGSSLPPITQNILKYCNEVIIVVEPTPNSVQQTKALIEDLYAADVGKLGILPVLVTRVRSGVQMKWLEVQEMLNQEIKTVITPVPELAFKAAQSKIPIIVDQPESDTAHQFEQLARLVSQ